MRKQELREDPIAFFNGHLAGMIVPILFLHLPGLLICLLVFEIPVLNYSQEILSFSVMIELLCFILFFSFFSFPFYCFVVFFVPPSILASRLLFFV